MKVVGDKSYLNSAFFLRLALGTAFLSSVASRFGMWPESSGWENFLAYTGKLNPWAPDALVPALGLTATFLELLIGAALVVGFRTREAAMISGILLLIFALAMASGEGLKAPFDYSVFTAAAASFLLASTVPADPVAAEIRERIQNTRNADPTMPPGPYMI